jgi:hypothetical protein
MPRTAAELRRDATATGYFNGPKLQYVGDGYTIPWQVAITLNPPTGFTLLLYKAYLDTLNLEASRLHDWLYTPYGGLINVTRDEADAALFEELSHSSPVDAVIVYAAVRAGGAPFFGTSQTGFAGIEQDQSVDNIAETPTIARKAATMPIKCVTVFQLTTEPGNSAPVIGYAGRSHIGGWTESWFFNSDTLSDAVTACFGPRADHDPMCIARARLLGHQATILGVRFYQSGGGKGVFISRTIPGGVHDTDQPQQAILCRTNNPAQDRARKFTLRGIPDVETVNGEFSPDAAYANAVETYFDSLFDFLFLCKTLNNQTGVFSVDASGIVTLKANTPFALNDLVYLFNAVDSQGKRQHWTNFVTIIGPGPNQFTIKGWPWGACTGGTVGKPTNSYNNAWATGNLPTVVRSVTRKIGRPFELYRGRRSKRRKTA